MKTAVLNEYCQPQVIKRIMAITPDSKGLWGIMTVNEMMFHCAKINGEILKGKENFQKPTWKQKGLQLLVLGLMKSIPKGIKTNPKYVKPKEDQTAFEELRNGFLASVNKVTLHGEEIYGNHPMLGPLQTNQWRRFIYMHLDHHLRQFGV